jgi:amidohydrolase
VASASPTMDLAAARAAAAAAVDAAADSLVRLSKYVHANPEIALEEVKASAACAEFLDERGFEVERNVAHLPTAFAATYGASGPSIAYLSEYDALPGLGHGCGHNLIAIAGIGAGVGLSAALPYLGTGRVTVFGTPAEEAVGGKILMADAGAFDGVDAALGAHPGTSDATCPTVDGSGEALACRLVVVEFHGKAAHAAADPHNGANALNALIETFNGINALRQHVKSDARIHGIITRGGEAPNVVPDYARGEFFVRGATVKYMDELTEQVRRIAEGAALMTGCRLDFSMPEPANSDMITNRVIARRLKQHLDDVGLRQPEAKAAPPSGSTDWGNVSYIVPSVETSYPILDRVCTWHSPDVVEASISEMGFANTLLVAKALALTGVDLIADPAFLDEVKAEFARSKAIREGAS